MGGSLYLTEESERRARGLPPRRRGISDLLGEQLATGATRFDELTGTEELPTGETPGPARLANTGLSVTPVPRENPWAAERTDAPVMRPRPVQAGGTINPRALLDASAQRPDQTATPTGTFVPAREGGAIPQTEADRRKKAIGAATGQAASENLTPAALTDFAERAHRAAEMHRSLGQMDEADELDRKSQNAAALARSLPYGEGGKLFGRHLAMGMLAPDPNAEEGRVIDEAQAPDMLPSDREQRTLGISRPFGNKRPSSISNDFLIPMAGQLPGLMAGGAAGRATVGAAGEALAATRRFRSIGEGLNALSRSVEVPEAFGPRIPITRLPAARLTEEITQLRAAAPALIQRGATEGQVVGFIQMYHQAREAGLEPEDAVGAAAEGAAMSVPLGILAEAGFHVAGRGMRAGVDVATEPIARGQAAAERMATARPAVQADAVHQMQADQEIRLGQEAVERMHREREQGEAAMQRHLDGNMSLPEALAQVRREADNPTPAPEHEERYASATEYVSATNKFVDAMLGETSARTPEQRTKAQVALARAKDALNVARKRYGAQAGIASVALLAANDDDLTKEEKQMIGLGAVALTTERARHYVATGMPEESRVRLALAMRRYAENTPDHFTRTTHTPDEITTILHDFQINGERLSPVDIGEARYIVSEMMNDPEHAHGVSTSALRDVLEGVVHEGEPAAAEAPNPQEALVARYTMPVEPTRETLRAPLARRRDAAAAIDRVRGRVPQASLSQWADEIAGNSHGAFTEDEAFALLEPIGKLYGPGRDFTYKELQAALTGPEEADRAFSSRLIGFLNSTPDAKGKGGLGRAWDQARPAADWIGKLAKEPAFSKREYGLIEPALKAAQAENRKLTRAEVVALAEEKLPKIERITYEDKSGRASGGETDDNDIQDIDEVVATENPDVADEQINARHGRIGAIEEEFTDAETNAREEMERAERQSDKYRDDIKEALGLERHADDDVFNAAIDMIHEGTYGSGDYDRNLVEKVVSKLQDEGGYDQGSDPEEALTQAGYTIEEENEKPLRRVRSRFRPVEMKEQMGFFKPGDKVGSFDLRYSEGNSDANHLDKIRKYFGDEAAANAEFYEHPTGLREVKVKDVPGGYGDIIVSGVHDWSTPDIAIEHARAHLVRRYGLTEEQAAAIPKRRFKVIDTEPGTEWVIRDSDGKEIARGDDRDDLMRDTATDRGMIEDRDWDHVSSEVGSYVDAYGQYQDAEREHFHISEEPEEWNRDLWREKETLEEEVQRLTALRDEWRERTPALTAPVPVVETDRLAPIAPVVHGDSKFHTYQRIGGGTDYAELLNVWANGPIDESERYDEGHWTGYGTDKRYNVLGHIRVETHAVHDLPDINAEKVAKLPDDNAAVSDAKQMISQNREKRDALLKRQGEIVAKLTAMDAEGTGGSGDAHTLAQEWQRANNDLKNLSTREDELVRKIANERGEPVRTRRVRVNLETQSRYARDAAVQGVRKDPPSESVVRAAQKKIDDLRVEQRLLHDERVTARQRRDEASTGYNELFSERNSELWNQYYAAREADQQAALMARLAPDLSDVIPWTPRAAERADYSPEDVTADNATRSASWSRFLLTLDHTDRARAQTAFEDFAAAAADYGRLSDKHNDYSTRINEATNEYNALTGRDGVMNSPFLVLGDKPAKTTAKGETRHDVNGWAVYTLNAARFLIDSAERGYESIAWSDGANRAKHAMGEGPDEIVFAQQLYDNIYKQAMVRLLGHLGFKDVPVTHTFIRGWGHWQITLTPEMRAAIRKYGLPMLGVMTLMATPEEAQAQGTAEAQADRSVLPTVLATAGGLAVGGSLVYYLMRSRAARLAIGSNPRLKAAAQMALTAVEREQNRAMGRPDFLYLRRDPIGSAYTAPLDVKQTPGGKGPALFNVEKMGLSTDGERVWTNVVQQLGLKKRYVSWDETRGAAEQRSTSVDDLLREKPWRGTDALAARLFQSQASERLSMLANELHKPGIAPDLSASIAAEMDRVAGDIADMAQRAAGEREAAGRTLNSYKIIAKHTMDPATWQMLAQRAKGDLALSSDEILKVQGFLARRDREALTAFISSLHRSTNLDKFLTLWKAGLLTSPTTHAVNILSNMGEAAMLAASQPAAVAIDALIALARGTEREKLLPRGLVWSRLKGFVAGMKEGRRVLATGVTPDEIGKWDSRKTNFDSPILQAYTNAVFNSLAAEDRPFYHMALHASLDELTTIYAKRAVRADPSLRFDQVKAALLADPPNEIAARAGAEASTAVFQNQGSLASLAAAARRGVRDKPVARTAFEMTAPFTRTPSNVATRFADSTPLGLATAILRQVNQHGPFDQRRFSEDIARALTGTGGLMLLGYWLAEQGLATGSAPTSPGDREVWRSQGKQPNSVYLNGRWENVARLGPAGMSIVAGAQYHTLSKENASASKLIGGMAGTVGKVVLDQSFLTGVSSALQTVADPVNAGESYTSRLAGSAVPAVVGRAAQATDDTEREAYTPGEQVRSRIPGASRSLRPRLNIFGEPMTRSAGARVGAVADPLSGATARDEPVIAEMDRLGVGATRPTKTRKISDPRTGQTVTITYTDEERHNALAEHIGPERRRLLEQLMFSGSFANMPDQARVKAIRSMLDKADDAFYARDDRARLRSRRSSAAPAAEPNAAP